MSRPGPESPSTAERATAFGQSEVLSRKSRLNNPVACSTFNGPRRGLLAATAVRLRPDPRVFPARSSSAVCQFFFGGLSVFLQRTVISDSSHQSIPNVKFGLSTLGMTAVSYVIWGMSGRGSRGTGHRNHELENHDDEITTDPRVLRNLRRGCVRFGFSRRSRCERPTDSGPDADEGPGPDAS